MTKEISLIRPNSMNEFIGQKDIKTNLNIYITSAKIQKTHLAHIMLSGGPGLGKTSCAFLCARIMENNIKTINGASLKKVTDITSILATLKEGDFLFIDEIHGMQKKVAEVLYSAMEDFVLDLIIGEGSQAKVVKIKLPTFTVIGATTKYGSLPEPLRDRFGIKFRFEEYNVEDLCTIIDNFTKKNSLSITTEAAEEVAKRAKRTPRIALNLTKRIVDFMYAKEQTILSKELVLFAFDTMGIDEEGLEVLDRKYLRILKPNTPMGLNTISAILHEETPQIEETIEPYLMSLHFMERTNKGRIITPKGIDHLQKFSHMK